MVAGEVRIGAIASFIVDADRYLLGTFYQEQLKVAVKDSKGKVKLHQAIIRTVRLY